MANILIFDEGDNSVIDYIKSANTAEYEGRSDALVNPNISALEGVNQKYWKHSGGSVVEMTQGEKDAVDAAEAAAQLSSQRTSAQGQIDSTDALGRIVRALALVTMDEINILRAQHLLADRTIDQLKTAIKNKISSGAAD